MENVKVYGWLSGIQGVQNISGFEAMVAFQP